MAGTGVCPRVTRQAMERFGVMAHPVNLISLASNDVGELLQLCRDNDTNDIGTLAPAQALPATAP